MLKPGPRVRPDYLPRDPKMRDVFELPKPGSADVLRNPTEFWGGVDRKMGQVVDAYERAMDVYGLAYMNDVMLRHIFALPDVVTSNDAQLRTAVDRMANAAFSNASQRRWNESNLAEFRKQMDSLRSSVRQLMRFVRRERLARQNCVYATSVWLDVAYGIDLLRAWVTRDKDGGFVMNFTAYQAKAHGGRDGIKPEIVRGLPARYTRQQESARQDLDFDFQWVENAIVRGADPVTRQNVDRSLKDLDSAQKLLGTLTRAPASDDVFGAVRSNYYRSLIVRQFADRLPGFSAEPTTYGLHGGQIVFRYLVDVGGELKELDRKSTENFGLKAA